jgi:hypothetical protein
MKTIKSYKSYSGIDASNEISLFEYGLLCKKENHNNINIIAGVSGDNGIYDEFIQTNLSLSDIEMIFNESWFEKESFLSFIGMDENDFINSWYVNQIHDMIAYYGTENILGSYYETFEIKSE